MQVVDTCYISDIGNYLFPHPFIYTLADYGVADWSGIAILITTDVLLTIALFTISSMRFCSAVRYATALVIYFFVSVVVSYICIYYYLSP